MSDELFSIIAVVQLKRTEFKFDYEIIKKKHSRRTAVYNPGADVRD
jgi:hypothetical protein